MPCLAEKKAEVSFVNFKKVNYSICWSKLISKLTSGKKMITSGNLVFEEQFATFLF